MPQDIPPESPHGQEQERYLVFTSVDFRFALSLRHVLEVSQALGHTLSSESKSRPLALAKLLGLKTKTPSAYLIWLTQLQDDQELGKLALAVDGVETISELSGFRRFRIPEYVFTDKPDFLGEFLCNGQDGIFLLDAKRLENRLTKTLTSTPPA